MNNCSDYSEIKKDIPCRDNLVSRSSVKRRMHYQQKIVNIEPLNFAEIRKEIEEAEKYENTLSNHGNSATTAKENVIAPKKKDDSFDLDFSALSIYTPKKKANTCSESPVLNKLPMCKEGVVTDFKNRIPNFNKNPKISYYNSNNSVCLETVDTKIKNKNESFANEVISQAKDGKQICEVICSIPNNIPADKTFQKINVKNIEYLILNLLGKGGSSEVYQCFCKENKQLVAIKCVSLENAAAAIGYINEVKILKKLQDSDKIVKLYDFEILNKEKKLLMVLEKCGDDLRTVLKQLALQQQCIPIYKLMFYWMEMLYAVKQIHSHGIIHSDLKPANFLNTSNGFLKLIDFGIASSVQQDMTSVMKVNLEGSWNYISPEALNNDTSSNPSSPNHNKANYKIHFKSDVWSLGCILYQLIYNRTPFQNITRMGAKLAYILNPNHKIEYPNVDWLPENIMRALKRCLTYDVKQRPSIDELIAEFK